MSQRKNKLELWIAEKLKEIDNRARPTKASGASTEILDIMNKYFFIEAKQKLTKLNITIDYKKEYLKSLEKMPINTQKSLLIITENKLRDKFVTLKAEDFFELMYQLYGEDK